MRIEIRNLTRSFGATTAVDAINATIEDGELVCILGPSGCGKTTTLNMLGGVIAPTSGQILVDGADVTAIPAERRSVGFVFQNYALYPHLTVAKNIEFPLSVAHVRKGERLKRVARIAELVQVTPLLKRRPAELSGGQQQRVAIARALVKEPDLLLLDEPLSNLDARLRLEMRAELRRIQQESAVTTVFVTHDQDEALGISDRTMLMNGGRVEQFAAPQELYDKPATLFTASFLGTPPINQVRGQVRDGDLYMAGGQVIARVADAGCQVAQAVVGIRSEAIRPRAHGGQAQARIQSIVEQGRDVHAHFDIFGHSLHATLSRRDVAGLQPGDVMSIGLEASGVHIFDSDGGQRVP